MAYQRGDCISKLEDEIDHLQDLLFEYGAMEHAPCFACGYDGHSYFEPEIHPCAARHHAAMKRKEDKRNERWLRR